MANVENTVVGLKTIVIRPSTRSAFIQKWTFLQEGAGSMVHHPLGYCLSLEIGKVHPNISYFAFKTLGNMNRWYFPTSQSDVCHITDEEAFLFIRSSLGLFIRSSQGCMIT